MDVAQDMTVLDPICRPESVIVGSCYRFSILTARLIRMEYAPDGEFEDRPTQLALNRNFPKTEYKVYETSSYLEIITDYLNVFYEKGPFTVHSLQIKVRSECCGIYCTWNFSEPITEGLGGTARTLDQADGEIPLESGIQSRIGGFGILDDSKSAVIQSDGRVVARKSGIEDTYFFGYGFAYKECLHDFFCLSGFTPLLPRYAFGNWWSRFHPYTDKEYLELMERFQKEGIPLSVAVIDMDWHLRNISPQYGKGWTGFTWNNDLFKNPTAFLTKLHEMNLKVTLNLHPAEGIQAHESMYESMAREMHRDPSQCQPVPFDFCDQSFIQAYFKHVIHPIEKQGVDFWWLDWQQGTVSRTPSLDPLWLLNYYHFVYADRGNKRPIILSRYAGAGSHRFPIGFSGDSIISWESLDFQPFFTANAANIGYGWWSHDIGGHAAGKRDAELQTRWLQFGVFSPILRLHSTSNLFNGKEPWNYQEPVRGIMADFMRLRHQLIPYLYTINWRCHTSGDLLVEPMYYKYPKDDAAYRLKNQYQFGSELIVCPITRPNNKITHRAHTTVWLPESDYFDFFTGNHYVGHRKMNIYRTLYTIPVFAKAGAIIPMTEKQEACRNGVGVPNAMEIKVFGGADGHFTLYEDDGITKDYLNRKYVLTELSFKWRANRNESYFTINTNPADFSILPAERQYTVQFIGVKNTDSIFVQSCGETIDIQKRYNPDKKMLSIELPPCPPSSPVEIAFCGGLDLEVNKVLESIYDLLNTAEIAYEAKDQIYHLLLTTQDAKKNLCELQTMDLPTELFGALMEIMFAE